MNRVQYLFWLLLLVLFSTVPAQEARGGWKPCLASCCIGPRVGLELNEGIPVRTSEIVNMVIPCVVPFQVLEEHGMTACTWSCMVGPRVGT